MILLLALALYANTAVGVQLDQVPVPLKSLMTEVVNLDLFLLKDESVSLNVLSWFHFK